MQKAHSNIEWENYPSIETPINEQNLNKMDKSVDEIDNRVIMLDTTKFNVSDAQMLIKGFSLNESTGIITITYVNGSTQNIQTSLSKIPDTLDYDPITQKLIIIHVDGTTTNVDLSEIITQNEFTDSDTVDFQLLADGSITAIVKEGSIQEKHLQPNYLADIKVEVGKAETAAESAKNSKDAAALSEASAAASAESAEQNNNAAQAAKEAAEASEESASASEQAAEDSANAAQESAEAAANSEASARESETNAATSAQAANNSATAAAGSEESAADSALLSKSWAIGNTGIRDGENTNCSEFYCNQSSGYRDAAEQFAQSAEDAMEQINKKLEIAEFSIDDDGNLVYTDTGSYTFTIDDNGDLNWEVAA